MVEVPYCRKCGEKFSGEEKYCPNCGANLTYQKQRGLSESSGKTKPESKKNEISGKCMFLLIVCLVLGVLLFLGCAKFERPEGAGETTACYSSFSMFQKKGADSCSDRFSPSDFGGGRYYHYESGWSVLMYWGALIIGISPLYGIYKSSTKKALIPLLLAWLMYSGGIIGVLIDTGLHFYWKGAGSIVFYIATFFIFLLWGVWRLQEE